jgi:hypothetical protein
MRPDELSALAAFNLLEMMFKSGVIAGRRPRDAHLRDRLMRSFAMPFAASRISQSGQGNVQQEWLAPTGSAEFQEGGMEPKIRSG